MGCQLSAQSLALQQRNSAILRGCQPDRLQQTDSQADQININKLNHIDQYKWTNNWTGRNGGPYLQESKAVLGAQTARQTRHALHRVAAVHYLEVGMEACKLTLWNKSSANTHGVKDVKPFNWRFCQKPLSKRQIHVVKKWSIASILQGESTCYHGEAGVDGFSQRMQPVLASPPIP